LSDTWGYGTRFEPEDRLCQNWLHCCLTRNLIKPRPERLSRRSHLTEANMPKSAPSSSQRQIDATGRPAVGCDVLSLSMGSPTATQRRRLKAGFCSRGDA